MSRRHIHTPLLLRRFKTKKSCKILFSAMGYFSINQIKPLMMMMSDCPQRVKISVFRVECEIFRVIWTSCATGFFFFIEGKIRLGFSPVTQKHFGSKFSLQWTLQSATESKFVCLSLRWRWRNILAMKTLLSRPKSWKLLHHPCTAADESTAEITNMSCDMQHFYISKSCPYCSWNVRINTAD